MKQLKVILYSLLSMGTVMFCQCAKDHNPFEVVSNARVYVDAQSCSVRVRKSDTLLIFTTETLAVYQTVTEKIDSLKFHVDSSLLTKDSVVKPPFSQGDYKFPFSFSDTGRKSITVIVYRSDKSQFHIGPDSFYVKSPLKQADINCALGSSLTLATRAVGDPAYYVWVFGQSSQDTIRSPFASNSGEHVYDIIPGAAKHTGLLWVTDTSGKVRSPVTTFTFQFYKPAAPVITCTNTKGVTGDTVVTGDSLFLLTFKVIDSSGTGLRSVQANGVSMFTIDTINFVDSINNIKNYSFTNAKTVRVAAVNNIGDSTVDTFYCYYSSTGPHPGQVRLALVNPPHSFTTNQDSIYVMVNYTNPDLDVLNLRVFDKAVQTGIVKRETNSTGTYIWKLYLIPGAHAIYSEADDVTLTDTVKTPIDTVTQNASYIDTTPPVILSITINGQPYSKGAFSDSLNTVQFSLYAIDNESGIALVYVTDGKKNDTLTFNNTTFQYVGKPILLGLLASATSESFQIIVKNGAGLLANPITIPVQKK